MKERVIDGIIGPTLAKYKGREIPTESPVEILAAKSDIRMHRVAATLAGRKGIGIQGVASGPSEAGHIAACTPENGLNPTDMHLIPLISELKTNFSQLMKLAHSLDYDANINGYSHPMIGGYVGGPEGAAIATVAASILSRSTHLSKISGHFAHDIRYQGNTGPESIWAESLSHQAISENTRLLVGGGASPTAGPCTYMLLYETAATSISTTVSGNAWLGGVRSATGIHENYCSGLEGKFAGEMIRTVAESGMKRSEANDIVRQLVSKYEAKLKNAPRGKPFQECYNLETCEPTQEWLDIYKAVKKELKDLGVAFSSLD
jgi:methylamine--corrinoid protein Co-methyltransferase